MSPWKRPLGILVIFLALSIFFVATRVQPLGVTTLRVSLFAAAYILWMIGLVVLVRGAKSRSLNGGRGFVGVLLIGSSVGPFLLGMILMFTPDVSGFWALGVVLLAGIIGLIGCVTLVSGVQRQLLTP